MGSTACHPDSDWNSHPVQSIEAGGWVCHSTLKGPKDTWYSICIISHISLVSLLNFNFHTFGFEDYLSCITSPCPSAYHLLPPLPHNKCISIPSLQVHVSGKRNWDYPMFPSGLTGFSTLSELIFLVYHIPLNFPSYYFVLILTQSVNMGKFVKGLR